jgi:hypothetical protein
MLPQVCKARSDTRAFVAGGWEIFGLSAYLYPFFVFV